MKISVTAQLRDLYFASTEIGRQFGKDFELFSPDRIVNKKGENRRQVSPMSTDVGRKTYGLLVWADLTKETRTKDVLQA